MTDEERKAWFAGRDRIVALIEHAIREKPEPRRTGKLLLDWLLAVARDQEPETHDDVAAEHAELLKGTHHG